MAYLTNGINGQLSGKVGSVVASSRNGVAYLKGTYKKRTKKISVLEKKNRIMFALAQAWLKPLLPFVRLGYQNYSRTVYGFVAAKSYLLKNAMVEDELGFHVDPALMQVSFGDLPLPEDLAFEYTGNGELRFSWRKDNLLNADPDDQVMLLAYNTSDAIAFFATTGQFRKNGNDVLQIEAKSGKCYQVYVAFTAADRNRQSMSCYLGELILR